MSEGWIRSDSSSMSLHHGSNIVHFQHAASLDVWVPVIKPWLAFSAGAKHINTFDLKKEKKILAHFKLVLHKLLESFWILTKWQHCRINLFIPAAVFTRLFQLSTNTHMFTLAALFGPHVRMCWLTSFKKTHLGHTGSFLTWNLSSVNVRFDRYLLISYLYFEILVVSDQNKRGQPHVNWYIVGLQLAIVINY